MPYQVSFTRPVEITDREQYINECCIGGDVIAGLLLPVVRDRYQDVESGQEDWGWYIWFKKGTLWLSIDIFTDDADAGQFRAHLSSNVKKLFGHRQVDTPELDELRGLAESELRRIGATEISTESA